MSLNYVWFKYGKLTLEYIYVITNFIYYTESDNFLIRKHAETPLFLMQLKVQALQVTSKNHCQIFDHQRWRQIFRLFEVRAK